MFHYLVSKYWTKLDPTCPPILRNTTDASAYFLISIHYKPPRPNSNNKKERFYYKMAASKPTFHSSF